MLQSIILGVKSTKHKDTITAGHKYADEHTVCGAKFVGNDIWGFAESILLEQFVLASALGRLGVHLMKASADFTHPFQGKLAATWGM